jgi:hypothetical protein
MVHEPPALYGPFLLLLTLLHHSIQSTNTFFADFDHMFAPILTALLAKLHQYISARDMVAPLYWWDSASCTNRRRNINILRIWKWLEQKYIICQKTVALILAVWYSFHKALCQLVRGFLPKISRIFGAFFKCHFCAAKIENKPRPHRCIKV